MRILPLVLAVALFMENMDANVISTSLPAIASDLDTSPIALKLALTSYLVSLAVFIPVSGWMADRFTARRIFRIAIGVFMAGSLLCAASSSLSAFVGARFLQGIGGAMMSPIARLLLVRSTPKADLVLAFSWLTIPALVGPVVGPPIGGFITTYSSWHWIFLINIPIGILGIIMASIHLPRDESIIIRPLDWPGFFLSGLGLSGFIFGLSLISLPALPQWLGFTMTFTGILCGLAYIAHAKRTRHPLLDLRLLQNTIFRISITGGNLFRLGIGALPFLLPMMLQLAFGLTPIQSGLITFISAVGALGMKFGVNRVFHRFGFRRILLIGTLLSAAFIAINGLFTLATPYVLILAPLLFGGFLRSMVFSGVNALAYADLAQEDISQATPILAVAQQASIALGVAIAGMVLELCLLTHPESLQLRDFHIAFFVVGGLSALAFLVFYRLPQNAGYQLAETKPPSSKTLVP
ncbi:MAG: MSF transporter [Candidatus Tokpelaia hoelldobleri]|uniref:MSF transporter n=1 Tax=Candidatus Tokpelaia hoelldobleri TaxID=1902579 RepID=A0A1U9JSS2_9HYPH|nr:MAG: MSF transporter [Candidatus Tokpelaia hoelldoblerii]